jgi:hypothetical protein
MGNVAPFSRRRLDGAERDRRQLQLQRSLGGSLWNAVSLDVGAQISNKGEPRATSSRLRTSSGMGRSTPGFRMLSSKRAKPAGQSNCTAVTATEDPQQAWLGPDW